MALPVTLAARYVVLSRRMVVLHSFVKKTDKVPAADMMLSRKRMKEIKHADT